MCGKKFSRSFINMQESVLGCLVSLGLQHACPTAQNSQSLAANDERSEMEKERSRRFRPIARFFMLL